VHTHKATFPDEGRDARLALAPPLTRASLVVSGRLLDWPETII